MAATASLARASVPAVLEAEGLRVGRVEKQAAFPRAVGRPVTGTREVGVEGRGKSRTSRLDVRATLSRSWPRFGARSLRLRALSGDVMVLRSVPVQVANELLEAGHACLDVRTPEEFAHGHIEGAVNVPFMFNRNGGMAKNDEFVSSVERVFGVEDEMVVVCQSGKRSMLACVELQRAGFTACTDMGGGIFQWLKSGLPCKRK